MKVLTDEGSLKPELAFDVYRGLNERSEELFFRAALIAIVCISLKYLGLELGELNIPGFKLLITNPRIVTGALGWFTVFYAAASAAKFREAMPYKRWCNKLLAKAQPDFSPATGAISAAMSIVYVLIFLSLIATVILAIAVVWGDMKYILNASIGRAFGWEPFIGAFDTCITPSN